MLLRWFLKSSSISSQIIISWDKNAIHFHQTYFFDKYLISCCHHSEDSYNIGVGELSQQHNLLQELDPVPSCTLVVHHLDGNLGGDYLDASILYIFFTYRELPHSPVHRPELTATNRILLKSAKYTISVTSECCSLNSKTYHELSGNLVFNNTV